MKKGIILEFERGGKIFAELLEEKAPNTCKIILKALPVEKRVIHAIWAGEEIFITNFTIPETLEFENETNNIEPGDVACLSSYIKRTVTNKKGDTAFCIFYGKARPRKAIDETVDVNVFAKIIDIEAIAKIGRRIRLEGAEKLSIKLGSSVD